MLEVPQEMKDQIDAVRGLVPRNAWIRQAIEEKLSYSEFGEKLVAHKETKLMRQARLFATNEIDKWEFYETTKHYPAELVAIAAGVKTDVVKTRRRDLRNMTAR